MKGISEHHRREVGVNLTGGRVNAVEIGQKILGMPEMDELVSEFCHENGIEAPLVDSRYIVAAPLEMKYPEEEPVPDQTMLDDVVTHQLKYREGKGGYEVSTKGDRRFSALVARLSDGYTIEEHYQLRVKGHGTLGIDHWKKGKGKPPRIRFDKDDLYRAYFGLWEQWALENPALIEELKRHADRHNKTLSDCFSHGRPVNQARALSEILERGALNTTFCR